MAAPSLSTLLPIDPITGRLQPLDPRFRLTTTIATRVTASEAAAIHFAARHAGLTKGRYLRLVAVEAATRALVEATGQEPR